MHLAEGRGWKGRLGRLMVRVGKGYWLGTEDGDEAWVAAQTGRHRRREPGVAEVPGVVERERRRRSGTGPPPPLVQGAGAQGQYLRVQES